MDVAAFLQSRAGSNDSDVAALVRKFGIDEGEAAEVFCAWLDTLTRRKRKARMSARTAAKLLPMLVEPYDPAYNSPDAFSSRWTVQ